MPVISARRALLSVESLLDHGPLAGDCEHERVQIDLEAVGNGVVVDAGRQTAGADEGVAVETQAIRKHAQL